MSDTSIITSEASATVVAPKVPHPIRTICVCVSALLAGIAVAHWYERHGHDSFDGYLEAHKTTITADREGRITAISQPEGQRVTIGDPLTILSDEGLENELGLIQDEIAQADIHLQRCLAESELDLQWRLAELDQKIVDYQLRSASYLKEKYDFELEKSMLADVLASNQTASLQDGDGLFRAFVVEGGAPEIERMTTALKMETMTNAADVSGAQVEICEQQLKRLESAKTTLPSTVRRKSGVDAAEASVARAKSQLARVESKRSGLTIVSNAVGKVGVYRVQEGDQVMPGQTIVELLDDARRHMRVEIPSSRISKFSVNQTVNVRFPGGTLRTGRVEWIAPQAIPTDSNSHGHESLILVHVEQSGELWPEVPVGTHVKVSLQ